MSKAALRRLCRNPFSGARELFRAVKAYGVETPIREQALNVLVFVFGSAIAAGGFLSLHNYATGQAQRDFQHPAREVAAVLTDAVDRHVKVARAAAALFSGKAQGPNRWTFFEFSRKTLLENPGVQAIEWIPRVAHTDRAALERRATKDGLFRFEFFDRGRDMARVFAPRRTEYFPVYYVEPYPGNEEQLGYDLSGDVDAFAMLNKARDEGRMIAVPIAKSARRLKQNPGFILVQPVYRTEVLPFTVAERQRELSGFVRVVIRLDRVMQQLRANLAAPPGYVVSFFARGKTGDPQFIYYDSMLPGSARPADPGDAANPGGVHFTRVYDLTDWRLRIVIMPVSNIFMRNISSAAWVFVIFALLMTALLLMYLVTSQAKSRTIEKSVIDRTATLEREIAQRKRIESDLRQAKEQAELASKAKSEFLAMMSHELRTPLNAVIGFSEMMTNKVFGPLGHERYNQYAVHICDSAGHLLSLINDILDLSKIEAEQYELHKEVVDIAGLWNGVHAMLREKIDAAALSVESNLVDSPLSIWADRRAFYQILLNLLSNAVKFTPESGKISVRADLDPEGRFVLVVSDTGIGIAAEDLDAVLEPFKQLESSLERSFEGTGLGLPLTQRLVELHDGHLDIKSEPQRGTTVTLVFDRDIVRENTNDGPNDSRQSTARLATQGGKLVEASRATS